MHLSSKILSSNEFKGPREAPDHFGLPYHQVYRQEGLTSVLEGMEEEGFSGSQYCVMQRSCNTFSEVNPHQLQYTNH